MALMQEDARELLQVDECAEDELSHSNPAAGASGWAKTKRYIVTTLAITVVAYAGLVAVLHHPATNPLTTGKHVKITKLPEILYMEERTHACDTKFKLLEVLHRNLDNKGPDSGEEGFFVKGSYEHAAEAPVELEMHIHALTPYRLPSNRPDKHGGNLFGFAQDAANKMCIVRMAAEAQVKVHVEIVSPGTHELFTLPQIALTFFDLDGTTAGCEEVILEPANDVVTAQDNRVTVDLSRREDGIVRFTNTAGRASIPTTMHAFDDESMRSHAAEVVFYHVSNFNLTMKTGPCSNRDFAFVGRANVQCNAGPSGDVPGVNIETAMPPPEPVTEAVQYCLFCWIHPSLAFIPPCSDTEAWWARLCE